MDQVFGRVMVSAAGNNINGDFIIMPGTNSDKMPGFEFERFDSSCALI